MEVRGQLHAQAALSPGKETSDTLGMKLVGPERQSGGSRERVCAIRQVGLEPHYSDVKPVVMTVIMAWTGTFHRLHTRQLSDHHTYQVAVSITKTRGNIG